MNNIICIYPCDETTDFLVPLQEILKQNGIPILKGDTREECHLREIFQSISDAECIVFLGHGSSSCLYGSGMTKFIDVDNIHLIKNKKLILLSCHSGEFIENNSLSPAIGFNKLPTSIEELRHIQDNDISYHPNLDDKDILYFNQVLINVVGKFIVDVMHNGFVQLEEKMRLYINKEISKILLDPQGLHNRELADLLYELKNDMIFNLGR